MNFPSNAYIHMKYMVLLDVIVDIPRFHLAWHTSGFPYPKSFHTCGSKNILHSELNGYHPIYEKDLTLPRYLRPHMTHFHRTILKWKHGFYHAETLN